MNDIHTLHWPSAGKILVWLTGREKGWASPANFAWAKWNHAHKRNDLEKCKSLPCHLHWTSSGELSLPATVISIGVENRRVWVEWGREHASVPIKTSFAEWQLFWSKVLSSTYICAASRGICVLSIFCCGKKSVSPTNGISDIREQVGKVFVRSMGAPGILEDGLLLPTVPPTKLGLASTPDIL